ncbi:hypothetical protein CJ030_MR1G001726 [Morella rubra]|uniref:Uncharacterized protein n=1 Tax=Morella rubra TaxID=262757 RepID=A0A6A1WU72_9ROSI|nr:hypothetical protein CJ030_MR1G001726 [Morella rubra]
MGQEGSATPSHEIQEEEAEEDEAEDEDPEEVEAEAKDRPKSDIPITASPRTPHTLVVGRSVSSRSLETRLALLEASVSDLKDQVLLVHCDMWAGFDEIISILAFLTTDMEIITHEACSTCHHYNNLGTSCR